VKHLSGTFWYDGGVGVNGYSVMRLNANVFA